MPRDPHDSAAWKSATGVSATVRKYNPLCQWLNPETAQQCTHPSEVVHHLKDWKDNPELFFDWANLVAVCADHHSGGQRGDTQNYSYCDTLGPMNNIYPHGHGLPCFHPRYVPLPERTLPIGSTTSVLGDAVLDAALAANTNVND